LPTPRPPGSLDGAEFVVRVSSLWTPYAVLTGTDDTEPVPATVNDPSLLEKPMAIGLIWSISLLEVGDEPVLLESVASSRGTVDRPDGESTRLRLAAGSELE
jgi:hypothetical protein